MACAAIDIAIRVALAVHAAQVFKAYCIDNGANRSHLGTVRVTAEGQGNMPCKGFVNKSRMMG